MNSLRNTDIAIVAAHMSQLARDRARAAAQAENRKTREYKSKVDRLVTNLILAAFEQSGRWGEGLVSLFKNGITLATREGRNPDSSFAARWKHCLSIMARRSMMQQAHYALRKHLRNDLQDDDDEVYDDNSE